MGDLDVGASRRLISGRACWHVWARAGTVAPPGTWHGLASRRVLASSFALPSWRRTANAPPADGLADRVALHDLHRVGVGDVAPLWGCLRKRRLARLVLPPRSPSVRPDNRTARGTQVSAATACARPCRTASKSRARTCRREACEPGPRPCARRRRAGAPAVFLGSFLADRHSHAARSILHRRRLPNCEASPNEIAVSRRRSATSGARGA
jgi:hypothetical protein